MSKKRRNDADSPDENGFAGKTGSDEETVFSGFGDADAAVDSDEDSEDLDDWSEASDQNETSSSEAGNEDGVKYVLGADGRTRMLLPEIDPVYDSHDSDQETYNTIGNISLDAYEGYPHIGYDINGKRIMRPAAGKALDTLLEKIEIPRNWIGMLDKATGEGLKLTEEELQMVKKISQNEIPDDDFNVYEDTIEYFTSIVQQSPLSAAPEPKRRFAPSKHEAKRVMKIVQAIREGRIVPRKPAARQQYIPQHDLWANEGAEIEHPMHIPAPKMPLPGHDESYHPPGEYLPTSEEVQKWKDDEDEDKKKWLPRDHDSLRKTPAWSDFLKERFERCLDLYLAPRVRRNKLNIDPESLLPSLPSPQDLRPFPTRTAVTFSGHTGPVRSISVDASGLWLASGGSEGKVIVWEVLTGRNVWSLTIDKLESIQCVAWGKGDSKAVLSVACGTNLYLIVPPIWSKDIETEAKEYISRGSGYSEQQSGDVATWSTPRPALSEDGVCLVINVNHTIKQTTWHKRGNYFATVCPEGSSNAVVIHQLSKRSSQSPFKRSKGQIQRADFHPFKPVLFVATQRYVKVYDLMAQSLSKTLLTGARWISSFDVHPKGDNVIVGSFDKRLIWHDLDLTDKPYKTLRYHERAVRDVKFHQGGHPLFSSASDDGTIQIFHGMVYNDLMQNPLLVGLKVLRGHRVVDGLGILSTVWHPRLPWLFSAGADGDIRTWV